MTGKLFLSLAALLCILAVLPCAAIAENLTPSAQWSPPVLDQLTPDSPAQLRILAVAQGEVGYQAGPDNANKYSKWFDGSNSPWCTEFYSWCTYMADMQWGTSLSGDRFPCKGTVTECRWGFVDRNLYIGADGLNYEGERQWLMGSDHYLGAHEYVPQPGDVMWVYIYGGSLRPDHTTIVEGVSQDSDGAVQIHVIEGNVNDQVQRAVYSLDDDRIVGFGTPETRAYTELTLDSRFGGVNILREELRALGYGAKPTYTQRLDTQTRDALRAFQKDWGLEATGRQDIPTRQALDAALGNLQ